RSRQEALTVEFSLSRKIAQHVTPRRARIASFALVGGYLRNVCASEDCAPGRRQLEDSPDFIVQQVGIIQQILFQRFLSIAKLKGSEQQLEDIGFRLRLGAKSLADQTPDKTPIGKHVSLLEFCLDPFRKPIRLTIPNDLKQNISRIVSVLPG